MSNQPRRPAGSTDGGQFAATPGGAESSVDLLPERVSVNDFTDDQFDALEALMPRGHATYSLLTDDAKYDAMVSAVSEAQENNNWWQPDDDTQPVDLNRILGGCPARPIAECDDLSFTATLEQYGDNPAATIMINGASPDVGFEVPAGTKALVVAQGHTSVWVGPGVRIEGLHHSSIIAEIAGAHIVGRDNAFVNANGANVMLLDNACGEFDEGSIVTARTNGGITLRDSKSQIIQLSSEFVQ